MKIMHGIALISSLMIFTGTALFSTEKSTDYIIENGKVMNLDGSSVERLQTDKEYKFSFDVKNKPLSPFLSLVGGSQAEALYGMTFTSDSGYIAVGITSSNDYDLNGMGYGGQDGVIVKLDSTGKKEWVKTIGGNRDDALTKVTKSLEGDDYIIIGYTNSKDGSLTGVEGPKSGSAGLFLKYDTHGNQKIIKKYTSSEPEQKGMLLFSVRPLSDGGYILSGQEGVGSSVNLNDNFDGILIRIDSNGEEIWRKTYGGSNSELFEGAKETLDGNIVVVGRAFSSDGDVAGMAKGHNDAQIIKYDKSGNLLWKKSFGGRNDDSFRDLIPTPDGGCIAVGYSKSVDGDMAGIKRTPEGDMDATIVKYNQNGDMIWKKVIAGTGTDYFLGIEPDRDGNYVITGFSASNDYDFMGMNNGAEDAVVVKIKDNGDTYTHIWTRTFGGSGAERLRGIVSLPDGGYAIAGNSNSTNGEFAGKNKGGDDAMVVKFSEDGTLGFSNCDEEVTSIEYRVNAITHEGPQIAMDGSFDDEIIKVNTSITREVIFEVPKIVGIQELEIYIKVIDFEDSNMMNNEIVLRLPVEEVKPTIPTLNLSPNTTSITNQSVVISANAEDGFGIDYIELPDGTKVYDNFATYTVNKNGFYTFIAYSNGGVPCLNSIFVGNIDSNPPYINISKNPVDEWNNVDTIIEVGVNDE